MAANFNTNKIFTASATMLGEFGCYSKRYMYCSGDQIEKNDMGEACSAYEGEERRTQSFGGETCGKETTWKT